MVAYKHYSFDLWLTLIKSNPQFKKERTLYFYNHFNSKGKTLEEVTVIFRQVDLMCNAVNERTGGNIDSEEMYLMVISLVNDNAFPLKEVDLVALYNEMELLLFTYIPVIYDKDTVRVLKCIKEKAGNTLSLLSNTGFIKGRTLRKVLQQIELDTYFDFQVYSDEVGASKPGAIIFQQLVSQVLALRGAIDLQEIVHIGDNALADIEGAKAAGISSVLINSNQTTISSVVS
jgi:putative hydrolase of the HAD superfamily